MKFLSKLFDMLFGWVSPKIDVDSSTFNPKGVAEMIEKNTATTEVSDKSDAVKPAKKPRKPRAKKEKKTELRVEE